MSNGLKIQWGIETSNYSGEATISFNVMFSNDRYSVFVTSNYQNDTYATTTNTAINKTSSRFSVKNYRSTAAAQATDSVLFSWFAIGY